MNNNTVFFATKINILNKKSKTSPGTIVDISEHHIRIATLTNDIAISQITDINNKNYEILDFALIHNLSKKQQLRSCFHDFSINLLRCLIFLYFWRRL
jgi:methionyl-tRNA formyltransferase